MLYLPRANKLNSDVVLVVAFMIATALQRCIEEADVDAITSSTNGGLPSNVYTGSLVTGLDVKCSVMQEMHVVEPIGDDVIGACYALARSPLLVDQQNKGR
jgi:hypothetical protein